MSINRKAWQQLMDTPGAIDRSHVALLLAKLDSLRDATLEEAAKVADGRATAFLDEGLNPEEFRAIAAAIRALKGKP